MKLASDAQAKVDKYRAMLAAARTQAEELHATLQLGILLWIPDCNEGRRLLERALAMAGNLGEHRSAAIAANLLAEIHRGAGDSDGAVRLAEQALASSRAAGDQRTEAGATNLIGKLHAQRGDFDAAVDCHERCRRLSEDCGFLEGVQAALNELGGLYGVRGELLKALDYYRECLRIDDELGDKFCMSMHRYNAGWVLEQLGQWEEAAENLYRAIALAEQNGYRDLELDAMNVLGELFLKRDNPRKAADMFRRVVDAERAEPRHRVLMRDALSNLGLALFRSNDLAAAERAFEEAEALCAESEDQREMAVLLCRMAELALAQGQLERTETLLARAQELAQGLELRRELAEAARVRALKAARSDQPEEARRQFEAAMGFLTEMRDSYELARVKLQYGQWLLGSGDREGARGLLSEASKKFRELAVVAESEEANRLLFQLEMPGGAEAALVSGVAGLAKIGLEPVSFFERALEIVCEGLGFSEGAVLLGDRPVVTRGNPDLDAAELARLKLQPASRRRAWAVPVADDGRQLGLLYLARAGDGGSAPAAGLLEELARVFSRSLRRLAELPARPAGAEVPGLKYRGIVGSSPKMLANLKVVSRVASASVPVLIRGESGTGKELVARALHDSGARRDKPFVAVNCASVPETLLEAEFFGVEKGTATGVAQRKGRFELADGGTVFLDEIGDMSPGLQARLLRVLQEKTVERLGGDRAIRVDVRVVAATNRDLTDLMKEGKFRQDLYYRLNAVEIELPALRDRREDIADFARFFVASSAQEFGRQVIGVDEEAMARLVAYGWPGNIRQLQHVIERAVILCDGSVLQVPDLPPELTCAATPEPETGGGVRAAVRRAEARASSDVERQLVQDCLEKAGWNVTKAAQLANYSRAQFYRLMRKHGLAKAE